MSGSNVQTPHLGYEITGSGEGQSTNSVVTYTTKSGYTLSLDASGNIALVGPVGAGGTSLLLQIACQDDRGTYNQTFSAEITTILVPYNESPGGAGESPT